MLYGQGFLTLNFDMAVRKDCPRWEVEVGEVDLLHGRMYLVLVPSNHGLAPTMSSRKSLKRTIGVAVETPGKAF